MKRKFTDTQILNKLLKELPIKEKDYKKSSHSDFLGMEKIYGQIRTINKSLAQHYGSSFRINFSDIDPIIHSRYVSKSKHDGLAESLAFVVDYIKELRRRKK